VVFLCVFPRKLYCCLVCLRAGIAEKDLFGKRVRDEEFGELYLRLYVIKV